MPGHRFFFRLFQNPKTPFLTVALASGLIYLLVFTLPYLLPRYYNTIPPVDYTKLTNYSAAGLLAYVFGIAALFGGYIWTVQRLRPAARPLSVGGRFIFGSSAAFAFTLIFSYPLTAIDLFIYAIRTRGWALYNLPPLATSPEALPAADPWLGLAGEWVDAASPYGPVWEWLSLGAFYLAGGDFLAHLFLLKIIGVLAYLGCVGLIYRSLKLTRPSWAMAGTIAFAWNPLVLFESVQNGHNDIVMTLFFLAAIWLLVAWEAGSHAPICPFVALQICVLLALSVLVKFVTALIAPLFLLAIAARQPTWPRRTGVLLGCGFTTAALVLLAMAPLWPGWNRWALLEAGGQAGRSLLALLVLGLRESLGTNAAFDWSRAAIFGAVGLIYWRYLWQMLRAPSLGTAVRAAFYVLFWYVLLAAPVFHAWYLLWFWPLAALLLPDLRPLAAAIVFSVTALLIIPYFETVRVWYPFLLRNQFVGHLIGVPLLIAPPALTLLRSISPAANSEV